MFFDIHSHILPNVDDGASDISESLALLKMMKKSGISVCLATPHFYPMEADLDSFADLTEKAYKELLRETEGKKLPKVYLGCEMLYYKGIGSSDVLKSICLNNSHFMLLELAMGDIHTTLFEDILKLKKQNITPIIAHIERYSADKGFKRLLAFVAENNIPVQINAASFLIKPLQKTIKKIFNLGVFCVIGTDSHSVEERPPLMKEALAAVTENFGKAMRSRLVKNASRLCGEITGEKIGK